MRARAFPAHDTLIDLINALNPRLFKACLVARIEDMRRRRSRPSHWFG